MKKLFTLLFCSLIFLAKSQAPQQISYQGIARSTTGQIIATQPIGVMFEILQGSSSGSIIFTETHTPSTNSFGLFTLAIGSANPSVFSTINWAAGPYFLKVYIDPSGGTSYIPLGTQQLMSVPYALYAEKSGNSTPNPTLSINAPNTISNPSTGVYNINVANPSLSINNNSLSISNGNTVVLPAGVTYTAGTGINLSGNVITNTAPNQTVTIAGSNVTGSYPNYTVNSAPAQTLSITGNTLDISNGNTVILPASTTYTAGTGIDLTGNIVTNTAPNQTVTISGTNVTGSYPNYTVNSTPAQTLSITGNTLDISNGNTVVLPAGTTYTAGTGIDLTGNIIANTSPDQIVSLFGIGGATVTGTYPSYTVSAAPGTNLPNGFNGQLMFFNGTIWDTIPQQNMFYAGNNIGIGTNDPQMNFHVVGAGRFDFSIESPQIYTDNIKITGGTTGQVLTSDGLGNGTWQTPSVNTPTITSGGVANVTNPSTNVYLVDVPAPALNYNSSTNELTVQQNGAVSTVTLNGTGSNTISINGAGIASVTPTTGSNFTVSVPSPSFATNGPTSISGSYPNYTVNSVTSPSTSLVQGNNISLTNTGNTYTVSSVTPTLSVVGGTLTGSYPTQTLSIPANTLTTITGSTNVLVTGSAPNYTISSPSQTLSVNTNSLSISGGNTIVIPTSTVVSTNTNISVTSGAGVYSLTAVTPTLIGTGATTITGTYPSYTVSSTQTPTTSVVSGANITVLGVSPSYTVSAASYSLTSNSNTLTLSNGSAITTATVPAVTLPLLTYTASASNAILQSGPITNTVAISNYSLTNLSNTLTLSNGVASSSAIVPVPLLAFSGTTLQSGPATNTVNLSSLSAWSSSVGLVYPTTLTNSVAVGTSGPTTGKFEVLHTATQANPTMHLRETTGNLNRIKFSNNTVAGKFFEMAAQTNATDANGAYSINYFDGTTYKPIFLVMGDRKVNINNLNTVLASLHVMENSTTAGNGIVSEGFAQAGQMIIARNNQPALAARTAVAAGDELGRLVFAGYNGASYTGNSSKISAYATENYTGSNQGNEMLFSTVKTGGLTTLDVLKLGANGDAIINPNNNDNGATLFVKGKIRLDSSITMAAYNTPPATSFISEGRIYFDRTANKFKVSENGGVYVDLVGAPSPWLYSGGTIFPLNNSNTDKVAIGQNIANSMLDISNSSTSTLAAFRPVVKMDNSNNAFNGNGVLEITKSAGTGALLYASSSYSIGDGLSVNLSNANNSGSGVQVVNFGQGTGGYFEVNNASSNAAAVHGKITSGTPSSAAIRGVNSAGSGNAGYFQITNSANTQTGLYLLNSGQGQGAYFENNNNSSFSSAVYAQSNSQAPTLKVINTNTVSGMGIEASTSAGIVFNGTSNSNASVIYANNTSTGRSIEAYSTSGHALYAANNSSASATAYFSNGGINDGVNVYSTGGRGMYVQSNSTSGSSALEAIQYGTGIGIIVTKGAGSTSGYVASFNNVSSSNGSDAVYMSNSGAGNTLYMNKPSGVSSGNVTRMENLSSSNPADAAYVLNNGGGAAIHAVSGPTVTGGTNAALWLESGHFKSTQSTAPTAITVSSSAPITGAAYSFTNSSDVKGMLQAVFTSTAAPATNIYAGGSITMRVTFAKAYSVAPIVVITPVQDMVGLSTYVGNITTTSFEITMKNSTAATINVPSVTMKFNYMVIE